LICKFYWILDPEVVFSTLKLEVGHEDVIVDKKDEKIGREFDASPFVEELIEFSSSIFLPM